MYARKHVLPEDKSNAKRERKQGALTLYKFLGTEMKIHLAAEY